jgi:hypothetical protein
MIMCFSRGMLIAAACPKPFPYPPHMAPPNTAHGCTDADLRADLAGRLCVDRKEVAVALIPGLGVSGSLEAALDLCASAAGNAPNS